MVKLIDKKKARRFQMRAGGFVFEPFVQDIAGIPKQVRTQRKKIIKKIKKKPKPKSEFPDFK